MRVDKVDQNKGIGYIKFNTDTEMDLIAESMDRLIKKQEKLVERMGGGGGGEGRRHKDMDEVKKLERFKKGKDSVVEIPKQNKIRLNMMREKIKAKHEDKNKKLIGITGVKPPEKEDIEDTEEFKNMSRVIADAEAGSSLSEGSEVTHRDIHVLANAINEHIWDMEKDGLYKKTRRNQNKYEKLKQMLENVQEQKSKFERVRPKPRGYGRLRK
jgi:hypothetical protein